MEKGPQLNNQEHFPYEIKISVYTTPKELKEKLLSGKPINFLVTKDFSIWLTDGPHNSLTDNGVTSEDVFSLGYARITDNKLSFKFYNEPVNSKEIKNDISIFFKI